MHVEAKAEIEREMLTGKLPDGSYADSYLLTVEVRVAGDVYETADGDAVVGLDEGLDLEDDRERDAAREALWFKFLELERIERLAGRAGRAGAKASQAVAS